MSPSQLDLERPSKSHSERVIVAVQVCLHCGNVYSYKRGRKLCPKCLTTLKNTVTVKKSP